MYTHGGPWLGPLPGEKSVTSIAACNGGGFKFSNPNAKASCSCGESFSV
jgi:Fe-S cluster assembly iron-binding protein IscA